MAVSLAKHTSETFEAAFIAHLQSLRTQTQSEVDERAAAKAHADTVPSDAYEAHSHHAEHK